MTEAKAKETEYKTEWTAKELAEAAGVSDARIRQLLKDGKLRGRKVGWMWIVSDGEARRWLEERQAT